MTTNRDKLMAALQRWQAALVDVDGDIDQLEDDKYELDEKLSALAKDKEWLATKIIAVRGEIAAHDAGTKDNEAETRQSKDAA
jgi:hypothetical protein